MKTKICLLAIAASVILAHPGFAQEEAVQTKPLETKQEAELTASQQEAQAAKERDKKLQQEERAKALLEKKPVVYTGFLVDASRAPEKKKFFSLRQPRDPKNDYRNVAVDERTGRPRGFVLFRVEF